MLLQQCAMCKTANQSVSLLMTSINRFYILTEKNYLYPCSFLFSVKTLILTDDCLRHDKYYWYMEGSKRMLRTIVYPLSTFMTFLVLKHNYLNSVNLIQVTLMRN